MEISEDKLPEVPAPVSPGMLGTDGDRLEKEEVWIGYFSPDRTVAHVSSEEPAEASDMCSSIRSSVFESDEFRFRFTVTGPGDRADCVIPPPNKAAPFVKAELEAWPEASRMPRMASVFPGEARPEEMICCTSAELEFRRVLFRSISRYRVDTEGPDEGFAE